MADRLAFNVRKSAYLLLEAGFTPEKTEKSLKDLKQATAGYYYSDDIFNLIHGVKQ